MADKYNKEVRILGNIGELRDKFDVVELSKKVKKQGDLLVLSQELKVRPRILQSARAEGRVLSLLPNIHKSKASILAALRTDREVKLFSKKHNINKISANQLRKLVKSWRDELQKNPCILITKEEHDLVVGSLMGDASIRQREKNSCFRFTHSLKQKSYAEWKHKILENFNVSEFRQVKRKIRDHFINAMDFATKTHPVFNHYRNLFYKDGIKTITKEILDQINPRSLAFWVCDDGGYENSQEYIILCTNAYSLDEHKLMKEFFNKRFNLDPTIGFRDGKYYYLRFKQEDSKKLIQLIKPFIIESMKYKIGEKNG